MDNMAEMMNNPMVKEMMNNPETMKAAMNMMGGGAGQGQGGGMNPDKMQDMMKNPSMDKIMQNPEFMSNAVEMIKSNPAMLEMMAKQIPGVAPETLVTGLEYMTSAAKAYTKVRNFFASKFV